MIIHYTLIHSNILKSAKSLKRVSKLTTYLARGRLGLAKNNLTASIRDLLTTDKALG